MPDGVGGRREAAGYRGGGYRTVPRGSCQLAANSDIGHFLANEFCENGNAAFPSSILRLVARTGCSMGGRREEIEEVALGEALAAAAAARFNEHKRAHAKLYKYRQV